MTCFSSAFLNLKQDVCLSSNTKEANERERERETEIEQKVLQHVFGDSGQACGKVRWACCLSTGGERWTQGAISAERVPST